MKSSRNNDPSESSSSSSSSFEWLTNFISLAPWLHPSFLFVSHQNYGDNYDDQDDKVLGPSSMRNKRVLHIGCGTSTLGMELQGTFPTYHYVLNVDHDDTTLLQVAQQWEELSRDHSSKMEDDIIHGGDDHQYGIFKPKCCFGYLDLKEDVQVMPGVLQTDTVVHENDAMTSPCTYFENMKNIPSQTFDLILDKSTLDCLLCSDNGTCGLLFNVYYHLKPGGIYFVVTFHHVDFILPLIRDCPGLEWSDIQHYKVERKVDSPEKVSQLKQNLYRHDVQEICKNMMHDLGIQDSSDLWNEWIQYQKKSNGSCSNSSVNHCIDGSIRHSSAWSSGSFEPNEEYRKYVTVFICRRIMKQDDDMSTFGSTSTTITSTFDHDAVTRHIQNCNNVYFQQNNPLVTHIRREELRLKFVHELELGCSNAITSLNPQKNSLHSLEVNMLLHMKKLPLERVYHVLFTDYERNEYDYNDFLMDWSEFQKEFLHSTSQDDDSGVLFETALSFLDIMQ